MASISLLRRVERFDLVDGRHCLSQRPVAQMRGSHPPQEPENDRVAREFEESQNGEVDPHLAFHHLSRGRCDCDYHFSCPRVDIQNLMLGCIQAGNRRANQTRT